MRREESGWQLEIAPADLDQARAVIEQYRRENRRWRWTHATPWSGEAFHFGAAIWALVLALFYLWDETSLLPIDDWGRMDNTAILARGEWWRLATAMCLHADLSHLAGNLVLGVVVLGLAMGRWGYGIGLAAAWCGGLLGNALGLLVYDVGHRNVGASGMVLAGLGLLATASVRQWRQHPQAWFWIGRGLMGGFLLFVLVGLDPASDLVAHAGGFCSGMLLGAGLAALPESPRHGRLQCLLAVGSLCAVVVAWALAWR